MCRVEGGDLTGRDFVKRTQHYVQAMTGPRVIKNIAKASFFFLYNFKVLMVLFFLAKTYCQGDIERYGSPIRSCCTIDVNATCGDNSQLGRVVGGKEADEKRWPWMVSYLPKSYRSVI